MGGCWSGTRSEVDIRQARRRHEEGGTLVINNFVVSDRGRAPAPRNNNVAPGSYNLNMPIKPCYGEYKCSNCGRFWSSTCSWPKPCSSRQACKHCETYVDPCYQRELRPSDEKARDEQKTGHITELCQRCKELGHHCGKQVSQTGYHGLRTDKNVKRKQSNYHYLYGKRGTKHKQLGYHCGYSNNKKVVTRKFF